METARYDEIGYWSEIKLDILKEYASAYSKILSSRRNPSFHHIYIDAFAGAGRHISKTTGEFVLGSPANALLVDPPFTEYFLIDLDPDKIELLDQLSHNRPNVHVFRGDCNKILLQHVFPKTAYRDYKRALCILDPYGLHLNWEVMYMAGQMGSIEFFLNFPVADMNRNVLWNKPDKVAQSQIERMNSFWGDDSWKMDAYTDSPQMSLFGDEKQIKQSNEHIAEAFRKRLKKVAGFKYVPKPIPMKNSHNAVVYYLFFASHKPVAAKIVDSIFNKYSSYMV